MLKRFFKPKWQHVNADIRQQAVEKLNLELPEEYDILLKMARYDDSKLVRRAAIDRVEQLPPLVEMLSDSAVPNELRDSLHHQVSVLLCRASGSALEERLKILNQVNEPTLFRYVVKNAQEGELQLAAAEKIAEEETLEELALHAKLAKVRQLAAAKIQQPERLKSIEIATKGKDKSVYRIVREKLAALKEHLEQKERDTQEAQQVMQSIERHARRSVDPLYGNKLQLLQKQWAALSESQREPLEERWKYANQRCEQLLEEWEETDYSDDIVSSDDAKREQSETLSVLEEALGLVKAEKELIQLDLPALQGVISTQTVRWNKAAEQHEPTDEERRQFDRLKGAIADYIEPVRRVKDHLQKVTALLEKFSEEKRSDLDAMGFRDIMGALKKLEKLSEQINWPTSLAKPTVVQLLEKTVERVKKQAEQLKQQSKEQVQAIKEGMTLLEEAIDAGSVKQAQKRLNQLLNRLNRIDDREASAYQAKMKRLQGRFHELRDWQGFANTPKKEALIQEMTQLIDSDIDPADKAKEIKALQDAWKALGPAEADREQALWQAFKEAGDRAFGPCKHYFSDQSKQRQANLQQRQLLCQQLEAYEQQHDWSKADWTVVLETLKAAKATWRTHSPVDRSDNRPVQERFDAVLDKIQQRLDAERDRNGRLKERLVERAAALIDHSSLDEAIEKAKALQQEWKAVGMTHRKADQAHWKAFRAACDKLFEQRNKQKSDDQAERAANQQRLEAIVEQITAVANSEDLLSKSSEAAQLTSEADALGSLPADSAKLVRQNYANALKHYQQRHAKAVERALEKGFEQMWSKARICEQFEAKLLDKSLTNDGLMAYKSSWAEIGELPAAAEATMNARFDFAVSHISEDESHYAEYQQAADKNNQLCRELVIRMEILAEIDSPAADQALRMQLQVDRLSGGLGRKSLAPEQVGEQKELEIQWCAAGPVHPSYYAGYSARMENALSCLKSGKVVESVE